MKFRINRDPLLRALQLASPFIPSMPMVKVLEFFAFQFTSKSLSIIGSGMQNAIRITKLPCTGEESANVLVPAKILTETVKALPANEELTLQVDIQNLTFTIHCSERISAEFKLSTISFDDYPKLSFKPPIFHKADAKHFHEGISSVFFSSSTDETKPASCGVNIHQEKSKTRFVANDGQQLSFKQIKRINGLESTITIHRRTVADLMAVLESCEEVEFGYSDSVFFLKGNNVEVFGPIIQEKFPPYQSILTKYEDPTTIIIACSDLIMSLRRMNGYSERVTHTVRLNVNVTKQQVELVSKDEHLDHSSREILPAEVTGRDITFALNIKRLIEIASHIETEKLKIEIKEHNKPVYVRPVSSENDKSEDFLTLLAPQAAY